MTRQTAYQKLGIIGIAVSLVFHALVSQAGARASASAFKNSSQDTLLPAYRLHGLNFSPYIDGQDPNRPCCRDIPEPQILERMKIISPYTRWIRSFGCTHGLQEIGRIAHSLGHKTAVGAWLGSETTAAGRQASQEEIANLILKASAGDVDLAIVGSEVLLRGDLPEGKLLGYIEQVRAAIPDTIPITYADVYSVWLDHPALIEAVDLIFANYYPYWEGVVVERAIATLHCWHQKMVAVAKGKPVIVSETGWPSCGNTIGRAIPSPENASFYFLNFVSWARTNEVGYFYFSAFDESWKAPYEGPQGACWGIWDKDGNLKPGMAAVFEGKLLPNNWETDALPCGAGSPEIRLTFVPPYGSFLNLEGQVCHVSPDSFRAAVYIYISPNIGWWTKPTFASPLTPIRCDGSWVTDITTGGVDHLATMIIAFLVPKDYRPPAAGRLPDLPMGLDTAAVAWTAVARRSLPDLTWSLEKKGAILAISFRQENQFPQYGALHMNSSYFRLNYGPESDWGTSVILLPSFWEQGRLYQGGSIIAMCKPVGEDLELSYKGTISTLETAGTLRLRPPQTDSISAQVNLRTSGSLNLDNRPGEAFKPVMLSSMHLSEQVWDAAAAFVDAREIPLPEANWIVEPPVNGKAFGLKGGGSLWKEYAPTVEIYLDRTLPISGWITRSIDPNDDNVGYWAATDRVLSTLQYTIKARKGFHLTRPPAPVLVSPSHREVVTSEKIRLFWDRSLPRVSSYRVQISDVSDFYSPVIDRIVGDSSLIVHGFAGQRSYFWRVAAVNGAGQGPFSDIRAFIRGRLPENEIGDDGMLLGNSPNPFNPETRIHFAVAHDHNVTVRIYNSLGQLTRTLIQNNPVKAGQHSVIWDGRDDFGVAVASGVYIYQLEIGDQVFVKRMSLLR
ncbi:MAG: hypothetical protein DKINENOH_04538 [bacterium]|nr:hypothetical protein [bacterium]